MALKGIKVIEFAGLAPAPFCGMLLSDFGATVTVIDRAVEHHIDVLREGKRTIALDIRHKDAQEIIYKMAKVSDVVIEPFRPGVMERLGLGPTNLMSINSSLIYARLSGFGQNGPLARRAGHDINYIAMSGFLSMLSSSSSSSSKMRNPTPPMNAIADFAGGGLLLAFGICTALVERSRSGLGQIIDCSMTEGASYVTSWMTRSQHLPYFGKPPGENVLDGGAYYYDTYETMDGKFMAVGAIEPQFFQNFINALGLPNLPQYPDNANDTKKQVIDQFKMKTQSEWTKIFEKLDSCVSPVLSWNEAYKHPQHQARKSFVDPALVDGHIVPKPAPLLSRTPAQPSILNGKNNYMKDVEMIFEEIGLNHSDLKGLHESGALHLPIDNNKL